MGPPQGILMTLIAPVEPPGDTVVTLGYQTSIRRYVSGTKFAVEHAKDTVVTLVYQWGHQEHWGAIGAIR